MAAKVDGQVVGLAASSFTSVSLDPPLGSFAIATGSRTWPALARAPRLGVTVLVEHHHDAVTLTDGLAWFDTSIDRTIDAGDHTIVLLQLHTWAHVEHSLPLVFHRSGFGLGQPR